MIKTIDTENITEEMFEAYRNTQHLADDGFTAAQIFAVLAAAPEVKGEPVAWLAIYDEEEAFNDDFTYNRVCEIAKEGDMCAVPVYKHPPASDLVERIRALKVGNVLDFGDYRHNAVIDRIVALIEGAR